MFNPRSTDKVRCKTQGITVGLRLEHPLSLPTYWETCSKIHVLSPVILYLMKSRVENLCLVFT